MSSEFESPESVFGPVASIESLDGTAIAYRQFGSGPPVVMVHCSGGGLHSWEPVAELLADRYEVWTPVRRGYAPSGPGRSPKSFADEVADLDALITKIGRPVHVVGMSYGGNVALHAAAAGLPIRSLVLWEPPLFAVGDKLAPVLEEFQELTAKGEQRRADRLLAEKVARIPAALLDLMDAGDSDSDANDTETDTVPAEPDEAPGWCRDLESLISDSADVDRWSDVTVPTLLMRGADTWQPMPETLDRLATALPQVTYTTLPGQMHFAPSLVPDVVAGQIADFLPHT
ncbi:alpha/beta fold hydrolase [Streptomyces sp. UC4497]